MPHSIQQHPLVLPNIVFNIIQHFDNVIFLESLRLVSHCWNGEVCTLLRRQKLIKLKTESSLIQYIKTFENTFEIFGSFPHSKYQLIQDYKVVGSHNDVPSKSLQSFLNKFGEFITNIDIPVRSGTFGVSTLDFILSKTPNLSTLQLSIYYFSVIPCEFELSQDADLNLRSVHTLIIQVDGIEISEYGTTFLLSQLFKSMPNLRRISYPGDIRRISKVGLLLRDIILDSESASRLKRLCEWEFKTCLSEEDSLKFLCKDFPMRILHIDLWYSEEDFNCISSELMAGLLRKWSQSLGELSVEFPLRKEISFHFHFPLVMKNLTLLYLGGFEGSLLELLKKLPSLRRLELSQLDLTSILQKPEDEKYSSVKQLRMDFCTGQTGGMLSRFSRIFPELLNLGMNHTTNEVARVIFQKMTKLIRLWMHGNELSDAGMCGFSETMMKDKDFMELSPTQGNNYRKYPFIGNLTELQYLKLDAYAVTEITVRHGLVHCTSLRLVKMDSTGCGACSDSSTVCRTFKLAEYGKHLVEQGNRTVVEMKEEAPLDQEALEFFQSHEHNENSEDLINVK